MALDKLYMTLDPDHFLDVKNKTKNCSAWNLSSTWFLCLSTRHLLIFNHHMKLWREMTYNTIMSPFTQFQSKAVTFHLKGWGRAMMHHFTWIGPWGESLTVLKGTSSSFMYLFKCPKSTAMRRNSVVLWFCTRNLFHQNKDNSIQWINYFGSLLFLNPPLCFFFFVLWFWTLLWRPVIWQMFAAESELI